MLVPQLVLAFMAIVSGWFLWKGLIVGSESMLGVETVQLAAAVEDSHGMHATHAYLLHGFAWILAIGAGVLLYLPGFAIASKLAAVPPLNILHAWARNKFYFDALYDVVTVGLSKTVAHIASVFDTSIVDGLVNLTALLARWVGFRTGDFDNKVVDGVFNGAASMAHGGGGVLRRAHSGRIRGYVLLLFAASVVALFAVITVAGYR